MKPFDQWVDDLAATAEPKRLVRRLTADAEHDRAEYESEHRGCHCFMGCAPCGDCTHPGNPRNQEEDPDAWEEVEE